MNYTPTSRGGILYRVYTRTFQINSIVGEKQKGIVLTRIVDQTMPGGNQMESSQSGGVSRQTEVLNLTAEVFRLLLPGKGFPEST